jgi:hypothetical protein
MESLTEAMLSRYIMRCNTMIKILNRSAIFRTLPQLEDGKARKV